MGDKKTGLAARMRAWMSVQQRDFSPAQVANGLGLPHGKERDSLRNAVSNFFQRGEIIRGKGGKYKYNHTWRRIDDSPVRDRVLKAAYVYGKPFTASDLQRLAGVPDKNYVQKILRRLAARGEIVRVAKDKGNYLIYRIADRERYRREVMK